MLITISLAHNIHTHSSRKASFTHHSTPIMTSEHSASGNGEAQLPATNDTIPKTSPAPPEPPTANASDAGAKTALAGNICFAEATAGAAGPKAPMANRRGTKMLTFRPRVLTGSRVPCIKEEVPVRAMILPSGQVFVSPRVQPDLPADDAFAGWVRKLRADINTAPKHRRFCFFPMSGSSRTPGGGVAPWGEVKLSKAIRRTPPGDKGLVIRGSSGRVYGRTGDAFPPLSPTTATLGEPKEGPEDRATSTDAVPQHGGFQAIHVAQFIFPVTGATASSLPDQPVPKATTAPEAGQQAYATESCIITFDLGNYNAVRPASMVEIENYMYDTVIRIMTHKFVALHAEWRGSTGGDAQDTEADLVAVAFDEAAPAAAGDGADADEAKEKNRFMLALAKGSLYFDTEACAYLSGVKALGADGKGADLNALVEALRIRQNKVAGGNGGKDGRSEADTDQARMLRYECAGTITRWRGKNKGPA